MGGTSRCARRARSRGLREEHDAHFSERTTRRPRAEQRSVRDPARCGTSTISARRPASPSSSGRESSFVSRARPDRCRRRGQDDERRVRRRRRPALGAQADLRRSSGGSTFARPRTRALGLGRSRHAWPWNLYTEAKLSRLVVLVRDADRQKKPSGKSASQAVPRAETGGCSPNRSASRGPSGLAISRARAARRRSLARGGRGAARIAIAGKSRRSQLRKAQKELRTPSVADDLARSATGRAGAAGSPRAPPFRHPPRRLERVRRAPSPPATALARPRHGQGAAARRRPSSPASTRCGGASPNAASRGTSSRGTLPAGPSSGAADARASATHEMPRSRRRRSRPSPGSWPTPAARRRAELAVAGAALAHSRHRRVPGAAVHAAAQARGGSGRRCRCDQAAGPRLRRGEAFSASSPSVASWPIWPETRERVAAPLHAERLFPCSRNSARAHASRNALGRRCVCVCVCVKTSVRRSPGASRDACRPAVIGVALVRFGLGP